MTTNQILRGGLYGSFLILLVSATFLLWPLLATPRFWLATGFTVGIVGTFIFTVALARGDNNSKTTDGNE